MLTDTVARSNTALRAAGRTRSPFFLALAGTLLLLLLAGFTPTLYLRPLFAVEPIPAYLYVHGAVLTSWFVWLVIQSALVQAGRPRVHRRLGVVGALLGAAVIPAGLMATIGVVSRVTAAGISLDADASTLGIGVTGAPVIAFLSQVVWTNLGSLSVFASFLAAALLLRRRPDAHRRLMLLASIGIIGPALARVARWPGLGGEQGPFVTTVLLGLLAALVVFDLVTRTRPHPATLVGVLAFIASMWGAGLIAASAAGQAFVRTLE